MTTTESPVLPVTTYYYFYNVHRLPAPSVVRFQPLSERLMGEDETSYLAQYEYELIDRVGEALAFYHSQMCSDIYLAIVHVADARGRYRLVFHIKDYPSLHEWRIHYAQDPQKILRTQGILPDPPSDPAENLADNKWCLELVKAVRKAPGGW